MRVLFIICHELATAAANEITEKIIQTVLSNDSNWLSIYLHLVRRMIVDKVKCRLVGDKI